MRFNTRVVQALPVADSATASDDGGSSISSNGVSGGGQHGTVGASSIDPQQQRWRLTTAPAHSSPRADGPGGEAVRTFDALLVCNGHFSEPRLPDSPGRLGTPSHRVSQGTWRPSPRSLKRSQARVRFADEAEPSLLSLALSPLWQLPKASGWRLQLWVPVSSNPVMLCRRGHVPRPPDAQPQLPGGGPLCRAARGGSRRRRLGRGHQPRNLSHCRRGESLISLWTSCRVSEGWHKAWKM